MSFELRAEEFTVVSNAQNSDGRTHEPARTYGRMDVRTYAYGTTVIFSEVLHPWVWIH